MSSKEQIAYRVSVVKKLENNFYTVSITTHKRKDVKYYQAPEKGEKEVTQDERYILT